MINIKTADLVDKTDWDNFLLSLNFSSHFFDWEWREILSKSFGHKPYYLIAKDQNGNTKAICPLFLVKSLLFGSSLISVPYINGGGILSIDDQASQEIKTHIKNLQQDLGCAYAELRAREESLNTYSDLTSRTHKVAMLLNLEDDSEKMFSFFPPKLRSQIRRPTKDGCYAKTITGSNVSRKDIYDFYSVFSTTMRDLGTPVYPKCFFTNSLNTFKDRATLTLVYHESTPVAAGITIRKGNYVEIPWAAALKSKNRLSPNMLLYWELIKQAISDGCTIFDFGRSTANSGTFKFKEQWGSKALQLHWYYLGEIPDVNPKSKKFELLVSIWRKLPVSVANLLGPQITKSLP